MHLIYKICSISEENDCLSEKIFVFVEFLVKMIDFGENLCFSNYECRVCWFSVGMLDIVTFVYDIVTSLHDIFTKLHDHFTKVIDIPIPCNKKELQPPQDCNSSNLLNFHYFFLLLFFHFVTEYGTL